MKLPPSKVVKFIPTFFKYSCMQWRKLKWSSCLEATAQLGRFLFQFAINPCPFFWMSEQFN